MFKLLTKKYLLCSLSIFFTLDCLAQDIDLYVANNSDEKAKVLIILDTSASMSIKTSEAGNCRSIWYDDGLKYATATCDDARIKVAERALNNLMDKNTDFEFGLMRMYHGEGGYVVNKIGTDTETIKATIPTIPMTWKTPTAETLWEAYLYLSGGTRDYSTQVGATDRDTSIENGDRYISPFKTNAEQCDNHISIIYVSDGAPWKDEERDPQIISAYKARFGANPTKYYNSYLNSLAKVIYETDDLYPTSPESNTANIYSIGFGRLSIKGRDILNKMAADGGGSFFLADNADELSKALDNTIINIKSVTDSLSSPSLSTVDGQKSHSDAIYYALFSPKESTRWHGNLKKLKISNGSIVDAKNQSAILSNGKFSPNAYTFWSNSTSPDGDNVLEGGANAQLSAQSSRTIYSDFGTSQLHPFNYTKATALKTIEELASDFNVSEDELENTINWTLGMDVDDENGNSNTSEKRNDIMGDPLHSKPVTLNYASHGTRILVGTNAGFLHMFKDDGDSVTESWAFTPSRLYPNHYKYRTKDTKRKYYGMDGPITIYFNDLNENGLIETGDKVWAFVGMRRGGSHYFGFDITNPDAPAYMWGGSISRGGSKSGRSLSVKKPVKNNSAFAELGQTWAKPQIAYAKATGDTPLLMFSAGYDLNQDSAKPQADTKGRGLYVIEAETGNLLWALTPNKGFQGLHSIPGGLTLVDTNHDGYTDRIYMGDMGGNIWRVELNDKNISNSMHYKLASLSTSNNKIKFFAPPKVARTYFSEVVNENGKTTRNQVPYDAIVIGSGDKTKPNNTNDVSDRLFMIRDKNIHNLNSYSLTPPTLVINDLMDITNDPFSQVLGDEKEFINTEADLATFKGWVYNLPSGEKSISAANIIGGVAYFTSYAPPTSISACDVNTGKGALYAMHLLYGAKVYNQVKYETQQVLPDAPQVYFSCDTSGGSQCDSKVSIIGPALTSSNGTEINGNATHWKPKSILGPVPKVLNGKVQLAETDGNMNLQLHKIYEFKKEKNDNK